MPTRDLGGLPDLVRPLLGDLRTALTGRLTRPRADGPEGGRTRDARLLNIDDVRAIARTRSCALPFGYVDSAAEDGTTAAANLQAFRDVTLRPRILADVTERDLSTTVLGRRLDLPVLLAPTGMPGIQHPHAEIGAAAAAHAAGTVLTVSMAASIPVTRIAAELPDAPLWFQLYPWGNPDDFTPYVRLAREARCEALVVTLDAPVGGNRETDVRTGFTMPPRLNPANLGEVLRHPAKFTRWLGLLASGPGVTMGNVKETGAHAGLSAVSAATMFESRFVPSFTREHLALVRRMWDGPLLLKGITTAEQARTAAALGADGVVVSNHGGRQLDGLPASLRALPEVADALAGTRVEVLLDGGVRRGTDVLKALALGARAVMIGRPWVWGLAAAGQAGVAKVLRILATETDRDMALMGIASLAELDPSCVDVPAAWAAAPRHATA